MEIGGFFDGEEIVADVPFGEGEAPATVRLRYISTERMAELLKKATRISYNAQHQREERVDNVEFKRLLGEAAVVGWSGILSGGQEVVFSPERRDVAMTRWTEFAKFVAERCDDLQALVAAQKETTRGN